MDQPKIFIKTAPFVLKMGRVVDGHIIICLDPHQYPLIELHQTILKMERWARTENIKKQICGQNYKNFIFESSIKTSERDVKYIELKINVILNEIIFHSDVNITLCCDYIWESENNYGLNFYLHEIIFL